MSGRETPVPGSGREVPAVGTGVRSGALSRTVGRLGQWYGAHPLHLVAVLGGMALAGRAVLGAAASPEWVVMAIWFAAAVIGHDLVLFPAYAAADRALGRIWGAGVNYVRVPLLGCALTFALFFPGILRRGADAYQAATGFDQRAYLTRWLLLCAAMFAVSALVLVVQGVRAALAVRTAERRR